MRRVLAAPALVSGLIVAAGCSSPSPAAHRQPVSYYLAVGDSLSVGVQPDAAGVSTETRRGYADQLSVLLRRQRPGLRLVRFGCPGETTATMLSGGICHYRGGSQLTAVTRFLHAHRRRVALITIDIGANDPDSCITQPSPGKLATCVGQSIPRATGNLTTILTRLRRAGPGIRIIGMDYYLPALAQWRSGAVGQGLARLAELAASGYNELLTGVYRSLGIRVADVSGAFHTGDFGHEQAVPGFGRLPRNVAAVCRWTWACAAPPRGPNQHPNRTGYQVIAGAFLAADR
jgi:lysophospholipase L1-like esterase